MNKAVMLRPLATLCGFAAMIAIGHASVLDASILLERASNNRTITVKYDGAAASSIEMVVNGVSVMTRSVDSTQGRGEVQLPLDTATLPDGESTVEVRLIDSKGKVVGTEITKVNIDRSGNGPAFLLSPKLGETVEGFLEIKVGFKSDLRNVFVSFFVDDEFKSLKNYPPYGFVWDTTKVLNGWHEVQAYAVDDSNNTFRTEKYRVFVNNPGGLTKRMVTIPAPKTLPTPTAPVAIAPVVPKPVVKTGALPAAPKVATKSHASSPTTVPNDSAPSTTNVEPSKIAIEPSTASPAGQSTTTVGTVDIKVAKAAPSSVPPTIEVPVAKPIETAVKVAPVTSQEAPIVKPLITDQTLSKPVAIAKPTSTPVTAKVSPVRASTPATPAKVPTEAPTAPVAVKPTVKPVAQTSDPVKTSTPEALFVPKAIPIKEGVRLSNVKDFGIAMDGVEMVFDVPGRVKNGVPTAPFRYLFERKGLAVDWHQKDKTVTAKGGDSLLWFQIGNTTAKYNGKDIQLESAPYLWKSRSFVPMSFVGVVLDVDVTYDPSTQHVMILSRNPVAKIPATSNAK